MSADTQKLARLAGHRGVYVDHGWNARGEHTLYGPVIWSETRLRWIADTSKKCGFKIVTADKVKAVAK